VFAEKIGPDPRNFNQRVSLGRNDLLIRTFPSSNGMKKGDEKRGNFVIRKLSFNVSVLN
jgi:hypothetical protein